MKARWVVTDDRRPRIGHLQYQLRQQKIWKWTMAAGITISLGFWVFL